MDTINALPNNVHKAYENFSEKSPKRPFLIRVLHLTLAAILLSAQANVNITSHYHEATALHIAASKGDPEILKLLSTAGADVNAQSKKRTPLHIARERGIMSK